MPLSEYEQRVLAQMEQQLRDADPKLAESMQTPARGAIDVRRLSLGILVALLGIGALVAGVAADQMWLGVLGFVGMLAGALLATTLSKGSTVSRSTGKTKLPKSTEGFMERQNERWEKRQGEG